jgi:hypothetical protein
MTKLPADAPITAKKLPLAAQSAVIAYVPAVEGTELLPLYKTLLTAPPLEQFTAAAIEEPVYACGLLVTESVGVERLLQTTDTLVILELATVPVSLLSVQIWPEGCVCIVTA